MRYLHLILIGTAIPMLLTATVFAAPGGGIFSTRANDATHIHNSDSGSSFAGGFVAAQATTGNNHDIILVAENLTNGLLAYRMDSHIVNTEEGAFDLTGKYSPAASIPGPTIEITEGDTVDLTVVNNLENGLVSVHVHGVHYNITSDGTLEHINGIGDQGATDSPTGSVTMHWTAGLGTAGTWPYHDHTFGGINGAEHKGLFGTVIVNPASGVIEAANNNEIEQIDVADVDKQFVLYLGDDAFWGMEIAGDGTQTPLWTNPTLGAETDDYVRFHLIALGSDVVHTFKLESYKWLDPGTDDLINKKDIGPLENHQFTIKAKNGSKDYEDRNTSNLLMGMEGKFKVTDSGADSIPSPIPEAY